MGSYSTKKTAITNMPKTLGVQDEGILLEGGSQISVLNDITEHVANTLNETIDYDSNVLYQYTEIDEGAVGSAFDFANRAFNNVSGNTAQMIDLQGVMAREQRRSTKDSLVFADNIVDASLDYADNVSGDSFRFAGDSMRMAEGVMGESLDFVGDSYAESVGIVRQGLESGRQMYENILAHSTGSTPFDFNKMIKVGVIGLISFMVLKKFM